jgi:hypothetical protein
VAHWRIVIVTPLNSVAAFVDGDGQHVYYIADNLQVEQLLYNPAKNVWVYWELPMLTGGFVADPRAPAVSGFSSMDGEHVFYVASNHHFQQLFYDTSANQWSSRDLTDLTGGPGTGIGRGILSSFVVGDSQQVNYLGD